MLRRLIPIAAACVSLAHAALLPDYYDQRPKSNTQSVAAPDPQLFEEYGFDQAERAGYGPMTVTAWRFRDTTGAIAGFQFLRPAAARKSDLGKMAAATPTEALLAQGNYVLQFTGRIPKGEEMNLFLAHAPRYEQAPLPTIMGFLPDQGLVRNSERYILGPVGLERFAKTIPPSTAAFHLSSEAEFAQYKGEKSEFSLVLFAYPTPTMARDQSVQFRKLPGAIVKRSGPLVAVVPNAPNPDDAERLLAKLNYEATVTMNEIPAHNQAIGWARALLNMFVLAGVILAFCVVSGLLFGAFRVLSRRWAPAGSDEAMIRLHLEGK